MVGELRGSEEEELGDAKALGVLVGGGGGGGSWVRRTIAVMGAMDEATIHAEVGKRMLRQDDGVVLLVVDEIANDVLRSVAQHMASAPTTNDVTVIQVEF